MGPDECVEVMERLRDLYKNVPPNTSKNQILKLKNTLMLIEMCLVSMRASMEKLLK